MTPLARARYVMTQAARVGFFAAHYAAARRLGGSFTRPGEEPFTPRAPRPPPGAARRAFLKLFRDDLAAVEQGLYPAPRPAAAEELPALLRRARAFLADVPAVDRRRLARAGTDVRAEPGAEAFPVYYRQNFHYQSGGWLTADSAALYDFQVETLFAGAADAMRRQALAALARSLQGARQEGHSLLDVACGAGRFLEQTREAFPRLPLAGVDLSPAYVDRARARLASARAVTLRTGAAEALPFADGAFTRATAIYLFHELPPRVRRAAAAEIARVLAPGGTFVFADSLQTGDDPALDAMLEYFPEGFHEPYFTSYLREDFDALFAAAGLRRVALGLAFLTRVAVYRKDD